MQANRDDDEQPCVKTRTCQNLGVVTLGVGVRPLVGRPGFACLGRFGRDRGVRFVAGELPVGREIFEVVVYAEERRVEGVPEQRRPTSIAR